ncbi:hypothetical protein JP0036_03670 [Helicobacter pylori]
MQQEIVVEEPNKITIAYNLEQTISKLKESVDLLEKNEQYNDAYALVCGIKSIVDEFHKDVTSIILSPLKEKESLLNV